MISLLVTFLLIVPLFLPIAESLPAKHGIRFHNGKKSGGILSKVTDVIKNVRGRFRKDSFDGHDNNLEDTRTLSSYGKELLHKSNTFEKFSLLVKHLSVISFGFNLHTVYGSYERDTPLKLFKTVNVDIDGDGRSDISVKLLIYPSIVRPFALALNYKLFVRKVDGLLEKKITLSFILSFTFPLIFSQRRRVQG